MSFNTLNHPVNTVDEKEIMKSLIRQEDERGEKPIRRFKHHVRRITRSSKNLFNDTYSAFMKKISDTSEKSDSQTSKSISSMYSNASVVNQSVILVRKDSQQFGRVHRTHHMHADQTHQHFYRRNALIGNELLNSIPPFPRSVSENFGIQNSPTSRAFSSNMKPISEYQDNTQSSPNIYLENIESQSTPSSPTHNANHGISFEAYSKHCATSSELNKKRVNRSKLKNIGSLSTLSSTSISTSEEIVSDSDVVVRDITCDPTEEFIRKAVIDECFDLEDSDRSSYGENDQQTTTVNCNIIEDDEESKLVASKLEKILNICCTNNAEDINWIQPGLDGDTFEDNDIPQKHTILDDLKNFSLKFHHKQVRKIVKF